MLANTTKAKPTFLSLILETTRIKMKRHTTATVTIGHVAATVTIRHTPPATKTTTTRREIEGFSFGLMLWEFKKKGSPLNPVLAGGSKDRRHTVTKSRKKMTPASTRPSMVSF
ncbi:unnamed protein product [Linum tenue]|uniref:Uncharacterized protein n=1 Tax=Linum tenue TaxID=586396 RepID=A0AAV0IR50_9ROSI|nr:unnamed protein product [Linum tenue]